MGREDKFGLPAAGLLVLSRPHGAQTDGHAVYDTQYHVVWAPKYRKWIRREEIRHRAGEVFREIAQDFGFEIEELEVAKDHVHLFLNFRPKYSVAKVVGILKSISASRLFAEYPELKTFVDTVPLAREKMLAA